MPLSSRKGCGRVFSFGATQPSEYMTQEVIAFVHVLSQYVLTKHSGQFEQSSLHTGMKSTLLHNIISKVLPPSRKTSPRTSDHAARPKQIIPYKQHSLKATGFLVRSRSHDSRIKLGLGSRFGAPARDLLLFQVCLRPNLVSDMKVHCVKVLSYIKQVCLLCTSPHAAFSAAHRTTRNQGG